MKKIIYIAAALLGAVACNKNEAPQVVSPVEPAARAILNVSVKGSGTKADAQTADEAKVNSLQVFVFNNDEVDVYGSDATGAKSITLNATTGARTVYAVVNAPSLASVKTMTGLKASLSNFTDNTGTSFVMVGSKAVTLAADSEVSIDVNRIAARLVINKVTRKFNAPGLAALDASKFEVVRAYVCDVVADQKYDLSKTSYDKWLSSTLKDGKIASDNALLCKSASAPATVAQDASLSFDASLYAYPNATAAESATAKFTRIILECKIDGAFYTYPILLKDGVANNKSYEIRELVLTRLGNPSNGDDVIDDGENDEIQAYDIPFGIEVKDWTVVLLGTEGTVTI